MERRIDVLFDDVLPASITCAPTVRPKRVIQASGSGSVFLMVPVAVPSTIRAPKASESVSVTVSAPSLWASSSTGTEMVFEVSLTAKVSEPRVLE